MAKINEDFPHDMFQFLHKPIRQADSKQSAFLERFLQGKQKIWEESIDPKITQILDLWVPAKTPAGALPFLKPIVGLTKELNRITDDLTDDDLRRIISLFVQMTGQKGLELGYKNIIRLFTGSESRVFNWFDFRMIVGESSFGEEQLGEDSWLISVPGVELSQPVHQVVGLWTWENNVFDRSIIRNDAIIVGSHLFSIENAVDGSEFSLLLNGGYMKIPPSSKYDFSGDFNIELFVKSTVSQNNIIFQQDDGPKNITIRFNSAANQVQFFLNDGISSVTGGFTPAEDIDDGVFRHLAFTFDRTNNLARMWYNGNGSPTENITGLLDMTMATTPILSSDTVFAQRFDGFMDNLRIATNAIYDVTSSTILIPPASFIEYQAEELDEFHSDVRVVDQGTLNRVLLKRILNIMRPNSERLNILFMDFYSNFNIGKGDFTTIQGSSTVTDGVLILQSDTIEHSDLPDDVNYKDIVLQTKVRVQEDITVIPTEPIAIGSRFFIQDNDNYYVVRMNLDDRTLRLFKVVATVETAISPAVFANIVEDVDYFITVATFFDTLNLETQIRIYHDRNLLIEVVDSTFEKGKFGMETNVATKLFVDEMEMFQFPLETDKLFPNVQV